MAIRNLKRKDMKLIIIVLTIFVVILLIMVFWNRKVYYDNGYNIGYNEGFSKGIEVGIEVDINNCEGEIITALRLECVPSFSCIELLTYVNEKSCFKPSQDSPNYQCSDVYYENGTNRDTGSIGVARLVDIEEYNNAKRVKLCVDYTEDSRWEEFKVKHNL